MASATPRAGITTRGTCALVLDKNFSNPNTLLRDAHAEGDTQLYAMYNEGRRRLLRIHSILPHRLRKFCESIPKIYQIERNFKMTIVASRPTEYQRYSFLEDVGGFFLFSKTSSHSIGNFIRRRLSEIHRLSLLTRRRLGMIGHVHQLLSQG